MKIFSFKKGYTLLFSVIVASIVLSIAAFILSTARKQFILSSAARDSTMAVYAAETGAQCALSSYFNNPNTLATSTYPSPQAVVLCVVPGTSDYTLLPTGSPSEIDTAMQLQNDATYRVWQTSTPIQFIDNTSGPCVRITVTVGFDKDSKKHKTIIDSRGYNDSSSFPCVAGGDVNPRAVERAVRLIYLD